MLVKLLQKTNAMLPMLLSLDPNVTLVKPRHLAKAHFAIIAVLSGIVMLVRLVQRVNALVPMLLTLEPIDMAVRLVQ